MPRRPNRTRQNWWPAVKWTTALAIFLAIGYASYRSGTEFALADVNRLNAQLQAAVAVGQELEQGNARLQSELTATRLAQAALQRRYDDDVPREAVADLVARIRARLDDGLAAERLAQVIQEAEPVMLCDGPLVSRRFRIGIEPRGADDDTTTFAEGMIRVRALAPAPGADLLQTTVVTVAGLGVEGGSLSVTGLPAQATLTLGNRTLRLSVSASGVAGFVTASLTTCRPG